MRTIAPCVDATRTYDFFAGRVRGIACGKGKGNFRSDHPKTPEAIAHYGLQLGVRKIFNPYCGNFTARVCSGDYAIDNSSSVLEEPHGMSVYSGVNIDGVFLKNPNEACAISTGDCPTLIVSFPDHTVFVGHAGLGSILNLERLSDKPSRKHESVVDAMFDSWKGDDRSEICAAVICGIQAQSYKHPVSHPEYGKFNASLIGYISDTYSPRFVQDSVTGDVTAGCINLFEIIRTQLEKYGVNPCNVIHDNENTADGSCRWWSHRRLRELKRKYPNRQDFPPDGRNLVMAWR